MGQYVNTRVPFPGGGIAEIAWQNLLTSLKRGEGVVLGETVREVEHNKVKLVVKYFQKRLLIILFTGTGKPVSSVIFSNCRAIFKPMLNKVNKKKKKKYVSSKKLFKCHYKTFFIIKIYKHLNYRKVNGKVISICCISGK